MGALDEQPPHLRGSGYTPRPPEGHFEVREEISMEVKVVENANPPDPLLIDPTGVD
jgi:hypothetical protein